MDSSVRVHIKLHSRFREHLPPEARGRATVTLPEGATVADLLDHLGIVRRVQLVTINGEQESDRTRALREGDEVRIFPFVVGG
jgi:sulfur carrier protein ThiS